MWTLLLPLSWAWPGLVANGDTALVVSGTEADGTRLTRVDEAGRPLGFVDVPGERPCAAVPWKQGFALVSVAPDGNGSRVLLRTVDPQGRPAAPVELGRSPEHPTYTSEWACKVAGSEAAVIAVWRSCEELQGHECSRYDGDDLKEAMVQLLRNPVAQAHYRRRSVLVEPVFDTLGRSVYGGAR